MSASREWCHDFLSCFYEDPSTVGYPRAKLFSEDRSFTQLNDVFSIITERKKMQLDFFGVIVNFTAPKRNSARASHAYSCTFFIIDHSYNVPAHSVAVVYFFNSVDSPIRDLRVGDVVCLRDFTLAEYNNFPQLSGSADKSKIYVCRNLHDYQTKGLYRFTLPDGIPSEFDRQHLLTLGNLPAQSISTSSSSSSKQGTTANWEFVFISVKSRTFSATDINLISQLAINAIYCLAQFIFLTSTLVDKTVPTAPYCNIHDILSFGGDESTEYNQLKPKGFSFNTTDTGFEKCDLIALVLSVTLGDDTRGTSYLLWDGTSNGSFNPDENCRKFMSKLKYPLAYHQLTENYPEQDWDDTESFLTEKRRVEESQPVFQVHTQEIKFLGIPLQVQAETACQNYYLARVQPGTWVRIRNLRWMKDAQSGFIRGKICVDTHVSTLGCYFCDPMVMSQRYFERVREREDVPVATSSSSAPSRNETMPQMQVPRRPARETNEKGDPFAPLANCVFRSAPAKFACFGKLLGWFPVSPAEWVRVSPSKKVPNKNDYTFLFSLNISDGTFHLPVVVYAEYAEKFLGISAEELYKDKDVQRSYLKKFEQLKNSEGYLDLYIQSYLVERKSSSNGRSSSSKKSKLTATDKRFAICDSVFSL